MDFYNLGVAHSFFWQYTWISISKEIIMYDKLSVKLHFNIPSLINNGALYIKS